MTTKASARQPIPPSRVDSGVEPPATAATPPVLSCMAMPGERTETLIATASMVRNWPLARPWVSLGSACWLICAGLFWCGGADRSSWRSFGGDRVRTGCRTSQWGCRRCLRRLPEEGRQAADPLLDLALGGSAEGHPQLVPTTAVGVEGRPGHVGDPQPGRGGHQRAGVDVRA